MLPISYIPTLKMKMKSVFEVTKFVVKGNKKRELFAQIYIPTLIIFMSRILKYIKALSFKPYI